MTDTDQATESVAESAAPLCVKCGYDLTGLDPGGTCPECGAPVAGALRGDLLSAADPSWLRTVQRGLVLITIGCLLVLVMIPTILLLPQVAHEYLDTHPLLSDLVEIIAGPLAAAAFLAGVVWVTTADPRLSLSEQPTGLRRITRGVALAALVLLAVKAFFNATGVTFTGALGHVSEWWGVVAFALFAFAPIGVTYYLARLAERLPDPARAARMRATARSAVIVFTLAVIFTFIEETPLSETVRRSRLALVYALAGLLVILGFLLTAIALMVGWSSLRKPIKRCLAEVRARAGRA